MGVRELDLVQDYTGHFADMVLGVYYAKARMYDAGDRRFMAVDPVRGSLSNTQTLVQYTYVIDNPLIFIDPYGKDFIWITAEDSVPISIPGLGQITSLGHASALVQDYNGDWFYFYWGKDHAMLLKLEDFAIEGIDYMIDPVGGMGNFNLWLKTLRDKGYVGTINYAEATYITGDFAKAYDYYLELVTKHGKGVSDDGKFIHGNSGYDNFWFNCLNATYSGLKHADSNFARIDSLSGGAIQLTTPNSYKNYISWFFKNKSFTKSE